MSWQTLPGSGAGLPPRTPDTRPDAAEDRGASATLWVAPGSESAEAPKCPRCGHTVSLFPSGAYCPCEPDALSVVPAKPAPYTAHPEVRFGLLVYAAAFALAVVAIAAAVTHAV